MFFKRKREQNIFELFKKHADLIGKTLCALEQTVELFLKEDPEFMQRSKEMHEYEHEADKYLIEIRKNLFEGAFFQGLRNDFAELIVTMDKIAGDCVIVGRKLSEEKPYLPEEISEIILDIAKESSAVSEPLLCAIDFLGTDLKEIEKVVEMVTEHEEAVDALMHKLLKRLFELDLDLANKLQIRDLVLYLSKITDKAEDIMDRISILAMNMKI
ncbi:MAG: hypothetical protein C0601_13465 [Candidatus Muiribacterium halophilum]|uniref:TIGR00153 family protein n=1 Tax=Muiribacterium halophilum TaxID=2053465 RepID=A0A2N5Z9H7_MUIH1|nr:MAG: hypothetical protein C0601_13465 [Candidatus Muirbacterium halophilum]